MKRIKASMVLMSCLCIAILLMPVFATATSSETSGDVILVGSEDELRAALESGKSVELTTDIKITEESAKAGGRPAGIAITGDGEVTIDGNGHTISSSDVRTIFEIYATGDGIDVTFSDVIVTNGYTYTSAKGAGRVIDTRTGDITLTLDGVTLSTTGNHNTQVLTIGGDYSELIDIEIVDSNIIASEAGYGIVTFNPVDLTIENSSVSGYSALYMKGKNGSQGSAGSVVTVKEESRLIGYNSFSNESSNFATIDFEDGGIVVNIENSLVEATSTGTCLQRAFWSSSNLSEDNIVTITGNSVITVDTEEEFAYNTNIVVKDGVSSNVEIDNTYILDGYKVIGDDDGNYLVVKKHVITVKTPNNGTITVDKAEVIEGETVSIIVAPNDGYELDTIKVVDEKNNEIEVVDSEFVMPDSEVTITAEIVKIAITTMIPAIDTSAIAEEMEVGVNETEKVEEILLDSLKSDEKLAEIANNTAVKVEVEIDKLEKTSIDESIVKVMKEKAGDATIATFFDVTIAVKHTKTNVLIDTLDELTEEIELALLLPEELKNTDDNVKRTYYVVRKHGEEVEMLKTTLSEDGKLLVFKTDKFSTYALAYTDTAVDITENPATGNSVYLYIMLASLSIGGIASSGLYIYRKKLANK